MNYYIIQPKTLKGLVTADIDDSLTWFGHYNGTSYLLATEEDLEDIVPLTDEELGVECETRSLDIHTVEAWLG